ncbi:hypothetical protein [Streptomyces sp. PT12]|uniref:hypothetical protein n=1 Tax=Streptomyces sp. PT12 TaxID=1510197 RepID=UPI000DE1DAC6|nr:hypothetical protein [Streptomyces sp. PT12]RBM06906.1 hypothetical protein DEH69_25970 [Streptomyces sp. PT12]
MRPTRKVALGFATAALLAGTAACGDSEETTDGSSGNGGGRSAGSPFEAVSAAAETTREVTSARFEATMSSPAQAGGDVEMSGAMSWDPELAMDLTMTGEALAADPSVPQEVDVVWVDGVMYMHMGQEFAAEFDGRGWMAMDLMSLAEETGDPAVADSMSFGLDSANQDPAQQLGLLLEAPEIQLVGEETLDGVGTTRYQGTISVEDAIERDGGTEALLTDEERDQLVEAMNSQGIESYDLDVWVDENDYPVQIHQSFDTDAGPVEYEVRYSDYGTDVSAEAPPAETVVDFMELLEQLESGMAQG